MRKIINLWKNMSLGMRISAAFLFANVVSAGVQYLALPVYTRLLTPDEYGQMQVFLTWVQVLGIVAMFSLQNGVFNNGMLDYPNERDAYSFSMLALSNLITLCFSAVLLGLYPWIGRYIGLDFSLLILMCTLFFFQPAYNFFIARERYEWKYKRSVLWSVITVIASPTVAVCCIFLAKNRLYGQIFGSQLTLIAIYAGFYFYLAKKSSFRVETKFWRQALSFNAPLIPHYLSQYLLSHSDRLMIARLVSDAAAGYYSLAYSISMVPTIVWTALSATALPYTYEKCREEDYGAISKRMLSVLTAFAGMCLLLVMLAPELIALMAAPEYREAIYVIPPIVAGVFFQSQYSMCANIVYYHKKPAYVMAASIVATVLNIILNYIFIQRYGYIAAGYTTLFSYMVQAVLNYAGMYRVVRRKVYDLRYLTVLSIVVIVFSLLSLFLYDIAVARYAIIAILLVICWLFRGKLIRPYLRLFRKLS